MQALLGALDGALLPVMCVAYGALGAAGTRLGRVTSLVTSLAW
jgi:hypothetical protein